MDEKCVRCGAPRDECQVCFMVEREDGVLFPMIEEVDGQPVFVTFSNEGEAEDVDKVAGPVREVNAGERFDIQGRSKEWACHSCFSEITDEVEKMFGERTD